MKSRKIQKPSRPWGDWLSQVLYVFTALFSLYLIWNHLNYIQIDLAGHLSSGVWFQRGFFHQFQDANFLGYVHGLFYPPLEDLILASLNWICGNSPELAFHFYLSLLILAFLAALYSLPSALHRPLWKTLSRVLLLSVLWVMKDGVLSYQGLSIQDLVVTGLTSQFLGAIFLFLFLKEWLGEFRPRPALVFLSLCLLSHIVVAMVALFVLAVDFLSQADRRKTTFRVVLISLLFSCFYLIPFVAYRGQLTSSKIFSESVWKLSLPLLFFAGLSWYLRSRFAKTLLTSSLALTLPVVAATAIPAVYEALPNFHYYRFSVLSLYIGIIGVFVLLDSWSPSTLKPGHRSMIWGASAVAAILMISQFSLLLPPLRGWSFTPTKLNLVGMGPTQFPEYGRYWVIGSSRSADFGLESLLQAHDPEFRAVKGLYWESSKNNLQLSSYIANLLSSPVVLDHYFYSGFNCQIQECLFDHFFRDYNIRGLMIEEDLALNYIKPERRFCYQQFMSKGETRLYSIRRMGGFEAAGKRFGNYWVDFKKFNDVTKISTNSAVDVLDFSQLVPYSRDNPIFFSEAFKNVFEACQRDRISEALYIESAQHQALRAEMSARTLAPATQFSPGSVTMTPLGSGRYKILVPGDQDALLRIKLNYYPMFRLTRPDGSEVRIFDGFPAMLAIGHGELTLEYQRSWVMVIGYLVSAVSFLLTIFLRWI